MPPGYVRTISDEIFYEYAKLISRAAMGKVDYPFVWNRYAALRSGEIHMSDTISEWYMELKTERCCVYCGSTDRLTADHLIPRSRGGTDSADNVVVACQGCNSKRGANGVYVWLGRKGKEKINRIVAGKYLKMLYDMHGAAGTLGVSAAEIVSLCHRCGNSGFCERDYCVRKLTCYCLESIF